MHVHFHRDIILLAYCCLDEDTEPLEICKRVREWGEWELLLAVLLYVLGAVVAVEELPLEELHGDDSKNEHEELVHNQDVEDVFQGCHHAVEHCLRAGGNKSQVFPQRDDCKVSIHFVGQASKQIMKISRKSDVLEKKTKTVLVRLKLAVNHCDPYKTT